MRPDSLLRLWRYINHLLTYLLTYKVGNAGLKNEGPHTNGWLHQKSTSTKGTIDPQDARLLTYCNICPACA